MFWLGRASIQQRLTVVSPTLASNPTYPSPHLQFQSACDIKASWALQTCKKHQDLVGKKFFQLPIHVVILILKVICANSETITGDGCIGMIEKALYVNYLWILSKNKVVSNYLRKSQIKENIFYRKRSSNIPLLWRNKFELNCPTKRR